MTETRWSFLGVKLDLEITIPQLLTMGPWDFGTLEPPPSIFSLSYSHNLQVKVSLESCYRP